MKRLSEKDVKKDVLSIGYKQITTEIEMIESMYLDFHHIKNHYEFDWPFSEYSPEWRNNSLHIHRELLELSAFEKEVNKLKIHEFFQ